MTSIFKLDRKAWSDEMIGGRATREYIEKAILHQFSEIDETSNSWHKAKEYADIILLSIHAIRQLGFEPEMVLRARIITRHLGRAEEIKQKYDNLINGVESD